VAKTLTEEQHEQALLNEYNFDCPDAFDIDSIVSTLRRLKEGKSVDIPVYSFVTHRVEKQKVTIATIDLSV
jgi:uridine kinase